ncbi:MAG: prolyl oligopeptidase family serine peptidase [Planctomycetota bacterium]|nr:prolyl oligopeptidase family serine peptidase [Planctomycetota bacterium]
MHQAKQPFVSELDGTRDYSLVISPASDGKTESGGDVAVYLHGHGGLPEQLFSHPCLVGLPALAAQAGITLVAPNLRGNAWMGPAAEADLVQLAAEIRRTLRPRRLLLTGASMGGTSVLIFEGLHPTLFDGYLAYCGAADMREYVAFCRATTAIPVLQQIADAIAQSYGGSPDDRPEVYRERSAVERAGAFERPTIFVHGGNDAIIPVGSARRLAQRLAGRPGIQYLEDADGSHDSIITPAIFMRHMQTLFAAAVKPAAA